MNILRKITTALRGGATEVGEAIVDSQALRILDQEIRDADLELSKSKDALAEIIAKCKLTERKLEAKRTKVAEYEAYALEALNKGEEKLAIEIAEKIGSLTTDADELAQQLAEFTNSQDQLRAAVNHAETNLNRLKQQVDTVRATESVQKAQASVAQRHSGTTSAMNNALESLERLKAKQEERAARFQAAQELAEESNGGLLDKKIKAAGLTPDRNSKEKILEKLRVKQAELKKS